MTSRRSARRSLFAGALALSVALGTVVLATPAGPVAGGSMSGAAGAAVHHDAAVPGEFILTLLDDTPDIETVLADLGPLAAEVQVLTRLSVAVRGAVITASPSAVAALAAHRSVARVEPSVPLAHAVHAGVTLAQPVDAAVASRLATLLRPATATQTSPPSWGLDRLDQRALPLDGLYRYPSAAQGVRIYVVDSGVASAHQELTGRVLPGFSAFGGSAEDCQGHGTHVAATAAGTTFGVSKAAVIVPVRVFDAAESNCTQTSSARVIAGLQWILEQHITGGAAAGQRAVVNLSIGGESQSADTVLEEHVKALVRNGLLVVAAAGNVENGALDACQVSPARMAEVLTVGATTQTDQVGGFSRRGSCVDLFAPGDAIRSAWIGSSSAQQVVSGTSMATPHVAGVAAQLIALNAGANITQVRSSLIALTTVGAIGGLDAASPNRLAYLDPALTPATNQTVAITSGSTPAVLTQTLAEGTARIAFENVTTTGNLAIARRDTAPSTGMTGAALLGAHYEITAPGVTFRRAEVCLPYREADLAATGRSAADLRLWRFTGTSGRTDITSRISTTTTQVCGFTTSFSPFGVGFTNTARIQGSDRYATAARIAQREVAAPVPVVYLASGAQFPDALSAAPAAVAEGGAVLLTRPDALPNNIRDQLIRLAPGRVVLVGGTGAISAAVESAVRAAVPGATIQRRAGATRYETAVAVSAAVFAPGVARVYVATGLGFPDALAAASAAGAVGAPVLLVPGSGPNAALPAVVAAELARLQPAEVILMGGTAAVAGVVREAIIAAVPGATLTRISGETRYDTATRVATPCAAGRLFVATGTQFADALAGAAVTGRLGCPLLLVPPTGWDASIDTALAALGATSVTILGGPAAVPYTAENRLAFSFPF